MAEDMALDPFNAAELDTVERLKKTLQALPQVHAGEPVWEPVHRGKPL